MAHAVSPIDADVDDVADFLLDLKLTGLPEREIVVALEHAAEMTGTWRSAQFATLRLAL